MSLLLTPIAFIAGVFVGFQARRLWARVVEAFENAIATNLHGK